MVALYHQNRLRPRVAASWLVIASHDTVKQLAFESDEVGMMQTSLHAVYCCCFGRYGRPGFGRFSERSVLQHGEKVIEVRKSDDLDFVANREAVELAALDVQTSACIFEEQILAGSLVSDDAFDMHAFAWSIINSILCDAVERKDRLIEGVH